MTEEEKQVVFVCCCCCCLKNPAVPHYRKAPNTHWHGCSLFFSHSLYYWKSFFFLLSSSDIIRTINGTLKPAVFIYYTRRRLVPMHAGLLTSQLAFIIQGPTTAITIADSRYRDQTLYRHSDKKFEENKKKGAIENKKGAHTKFKKQ